MTILERIKAHASDFPNISKAELITVLSSIAERELSGIKRLKALKQPLEQNQMETVALHEICTTLLTYIPNEGRINFETLMIKAAIINNESSLIVQYARLLLDECEKQSMDAVDEWAARLCSVLDGHHQPTLVPLLFLTSLNTPTQFAGMLVYLVRYGYSSDGIFNSGLLHQFFENNGDTNIDAIQQAYMMFRRTKSCRMDSYKGIISQQLLDLASKYGGSQLPKKNITLDGITRKQEPLYKAITPITAKPFSVDNSTLASLYAFAGLRFLVYLLSIDWRTGCTYHQSQMVEKFITKHLSSLSRQELKELYNMVPSLINKDIQPVVYKYIGSSLSPTQLHDINADYQQQVQQLKEELFTYTQANLPFTPDTYLTLIDLQHTHHAKLNELRQWATASLSYPMEPYAFHAMIMANAYQYPSFHFEDYLDIAYPDEASKGYATPYTLADMMVGRKRALLECLFRTDDPSLLQTLQTVLFTYYPNQTLFLGQLANLPPAAEVHPLFAWKQRILMYCVCQETNVSVQAMLLKKIGDSDTVWHEAPSTLKIRVVHADFKIVLNKLVARFSQGLSEKELRNDMMHFLNEQYNYSLPTPIMYTDIPHHPLTTLCCEIAAWIVDTTPVGENKPNLLELLIPSIVFESGIDGYPDLVPPEDCNLVEWMKGILATHILERPGRCLLPVKLLTTITDRPGQAVSLRNPYVAISSTHASDYYVSSEAYQRLTTHSFLTRAIVDAKQELDAIGSHSATLLAQLYQLTNVLQRNSAHGGIGSQDDAASGIYSGIVTFNQYYDGFPTELIATIPAPVKEQIDLLRTLAAPGENVEANKTRKGVDLMQTCAGTRYEALLAAIEQHKTMLANIRLTQEQTDKLLVQAQAKLKNAQQALDDAITHHTYDTYACDQRGRITATLLNELDVQLSFTSEDDLALFCQLSPAGITELLQDKLTRQVVIRYLMNEGTALDKLVILFLSMTPEQITAFLTPCAEDLAENHIISKNYYEVRPFISSFTKEKSMAICLGLQKVITRDVYVAQELLKVFFSDSKQYDVFLKTVGARLPELSSSAYEFGAWIKHCCRTQAHRHDALEIMKTHLPTLITMFTDFTTMGLNKHTVSDEDLDMIVKILDAKLYAVINNHDSFDQVLSAFNTKQSTVIYEAVSEKVPSFIVTKYDLLAVLEHIPLTHCAPFCMTIKKTHPRIVNEMAYDIFRYRPRERINIIVNAFEEIFTSPGNFLKAMYDKNAYYTKTVCHIMLQNQDSEATYQQFRQIHDTLPPEFGYSHIILCTALTLLIKHNMRHKTALSDMSFLKANATQLGTYQTMLQNLLTKLMTEPLQIIPQDIDEVLAMLPHMTMIKYKQVLKENLVDYQTQLTGHPDSPSNQYY